MLDEPAQQVLSQLAEMVLWTKTRWYNGDEADIISFAHKIQEQLTVPLHFDDLIPLVDEVETLLREIKALSGACCPDNVTYFPPTGVPDAGYDPVDGPAPSTWGPDEPVADLDDYHELICGAAHAYVDYLVSVGDTLDSLVLSGAVVVGALAAILGILSGAGLLVAIEYSAVAGVVSAIVAGATSSLFGDASDALEAARSDLICSMLHFDGQDLADLIQATVSGLAWTLFFSHIDYQNALNVMQTGEYEGATMPVVRRTDCDCVDYSNPPAGPYFAVAIVDGEITMTPKTAFGATCTITPVYNASDEMLTLDLAGQSTAQITSTFGLTNFGPTGTPCSDIKGIAFTVDAFTSTSGNTPTLWANVNHWKDGGSAPTPQAGDKVALGAFNYADTTIKNWLDANYDYWGNLQNGLGEYFGMSHGPESSPYYKQDQITMHNLYWLALTATSDCTERYS